MTGRKIDVIANDGSPLGVTEKTIYGDPFQLGVGGAELAILTLCKAWQNLDNDVTFYNNPREGGASTFKQRTLDEFVPDADRDILIIFRSPNIRVHGAKGKKIWFSTDQYTVGDFRGFAGLVDKIVTISKFHSNYFQSMYGISNSIPIDLPVRTWEYKDKIDKIPKRCIFTSIPDRGLMPLNAAWAKISQQVPDASLVITSDWRLWSNMVDESLIASYRLAFAGMPNVTYRGAVRRGELIQIQKEACLQLYPGTYEELFGIAVAESQVAGVVPITSNIGALSETNMGVVLSGIATQPDFIERFVELTVQLLNDPKLKEKQEHLQDVAMKRFSLETILPKWEEVFA